MLSVSVYVGPATQLLFSRRISALDPAVGAGLSFNQSLASGYLWRSTLLLLVAESQCGSPFGKVELQENSLLYRSGTRFPPWPRHCPLKTMATGHLRWEGIPSRLSFLFWYRDYFHA